jgi:hypothetical protein
VTQSWLDELAVALPSGLPPGTVSYVDRDWLTEAGNPVPALSFTPDGEVSWRGCQLGRLAADTDPTTVAAGALLRVACDAAAAATGRLRGAVEVVGAGLVAAHVRRLLGDGARHSGGSPGAVVDTTGDPEVIRSALDRVSDLGMMVLAGESAGPALDLDLYSSVHRRGLVVVGVASPLHGFDVVAESDLDEEALAACRKELAEVSSGAPVPGDSLWYRFVT